jgi:hypothetical protein
LALSEKRACRNGRLFYFGKETMKAGILFSRIRKEEKMLMDRFRLRNVDFDLIDVREVVFDLHNMDRWLQYDVFWIAVSVIHKLRLYLKSLKPGIFPV